MSKHIYTHTPNHSNAYHFSDDEGYLYFNDILHAAFKRTYGGERSLEDIVPKAVLLEEAKARKKLEQLKKKVNILEMH